MEADWAVEIGAGASVIDALWVGFIDLRQEPDRVGEIRETRDLPALADALVRINGVSSSLWTAKCDVWLLEEFDPDEMDARADASVARACYVDLLPRAGLVFREWKEAEEWARVVATRLCQVVCPCCRVDLIVRQSLAGNQDGFGVTAYIAGCGVDSDAATHALSAALAVLVDILMASPTGPGTQETLQ
jgi:hypothetical protein